MRFGLYAGASAALAAGAVIRACLERPNFYSSSVYIAQSNACLFILINLALLSTYSVLLGLQKAMYGPLRPVEVEQLWEKAWFADEGKPPNPVQTIAIKQIGNQLLPISHLVHPGDYPNITSPSCLGFG
ncbi:MAG: hypothetical protein Q9228_004174 [Teloschistes exilis]